MAETIHLLGSLGEFIGAIAVVATLVYLAIQVRHGSVLLEANKVSMDENARLARAAAVDRYSDAVSRWRGRIIESQELANLWNAAIRGDDLDDASQLRFDNLVIDWHNTYRANFRRATTVGDEGLARQAVVSVAVPLTDSAVLKDAWESGRPFNELGAPDFVAAVDEEIAARRTRSVGPVH
jgi:hypothetical protein